jgi:hypothetical protein
MKNLLSCLLVLAACGGGGGSDDGTGDAPPAAAMVTLSGIVSSRGLGGATPEAGVLVAAYSTDNETTPLAMATTDASGTFTLTITTTGTAITGYLQATKTGFITSYLYTPTPIAADQAMIPMNMIQSNLWETFSNLATGMQLPANGVAAMIVVSGAVLTSPPVAGATISTSPASNPYRYSGSNGLPNKDAPSTSTDGIGYAFNAPPGTMTVTAMKSGSTFKSTPIKIRAMALTQTLVIQ